ncbi:MAG: aminoglycoside phosphotransferase family protein [Deinococcales bacterium]
MDAADLLRRHGLPTVGLEPVAGGTVNRTWRTEGHVVRIGDAADHAREAALARHARRIGLATPRAVAHGASYSIWERLPGTSAAVFGPVPDATWDRLLDDLERLHRHPLEARPVDAPTTWRGRTEWVDRTQERACWTAAERSSLLRILDAERPLRHPAFVHGDAYGGNVLVDGKGCYVAVLDWGCAGWSALEAECARLEDPALVLALERWASDLDLSLVWAMRLELLLEVTHLGRADAGAVRRALDEAP